MFKDLLILENLSVALDTLRSRKARSALTVLGIVIGVTSVISVAAIIDGLNLYIKSRIALVGSRLFFVTRIPFGTDPMHPPQRIRTRRYLDVSDAAFLREAFPSVAYTAIFADRFGPGVKQNEIRYGKEQVERFFLRGSEPDLAQAVPQFATSAGRFFTSDDIEHSRAVAVIGAGIAETLFSQL